ncbi:hypothetical protein H0H87_000243 [Tephrocybe sp. NHM501043]|nr:hypothetical protein H0H87_000243 [Tephrocybe sp. NHM501043]
MLPDSLSVAATPPNHFMQSSSYDHRLDATRLFYALSTPTTSSIVRMPLSPAFPPEIFSAILQHYTLPHDVRRLSTLSLVSSWFRKQCQSVLFHSISVLATSSINLRERFNIFCNMMLHNPSLAKHVHTFQLRIFVSERDDLGAIHLPTFPHLRSFRLQPFSLLPQAWESDVCRIIQQPGIEEVSFMLYASLPFNLLVSCSNVRTVSISGQMEFYHTEDAHGIMCSSVVTYPNVKELERPNTLDTLILHNPNGAHQILDNMHYPWFPFSVQSLRSLALNLWETSEHTQNLIALSSESLRLLKLNISGE